MLRQPLIMPTLDPKGKTSRRRFLDVVLGTSLVAWLASILYPIGRYLKPLPRSGPTGPTRLTRAELAKLEQKHFVIVPAGGKRVLVLEDSAHQVLAFSAKCTHEGCTVQYLPGQSVIWCACHNGRFGLDGHVLSGPPPRPLPEYTVQRQEDGGITLILEKPRNA